MTVLIHFTKIGSRQGELSSHMLRCTPPTEIKNVWEQFAGRVDEKVDE